MEKLRYHDMLRDAIKEFVSISRCKTLKRPKFFLSGLRGKQDRAQCIVRGKLHEGVCCSKGLGCLRVSGLIMTTCILLRGKVRYVSLQPVVHKWAVCSMRKGKQRVLLLRLFYRSLVVVRVGQEPSKAESVISVSAKVGPCSNIWFGKYVIFCGPFGCLNFLVSWNFILMWVRFILGSLLCCRGFISSGIVLCL